MSSNEYSLDDYEAFGAARNGKRVVCVNGQSVDGGEHFVAETFNLFSREKRWRIESRTVTVTMTEDESESVYRGLEYASTATPFSDAKDVWAKLAKRFKVEAMKLMTRDDVLDLCSRYDACDEATDWLRSQSPGATAEQLLAACKRGDWLLWLASRIGVGDVHVYVRIACGMARSVLHLVPEGETRPLAAIELAERSLAETMPQEELIAALDAAARAAGAAACDAAGVAARAAALAAGDAAWSAAWAADAAWSAARAAARAAGNAAYAAAWAADAARDRASQADIVRKHLPLEMWEIASGADRSD